MERALAPMCGRWWIMSAVTRIDLDEAPSDEEMAARAEAWLT
jgi:hypothetical protein